jgi:hypothetical protein
MILGALLGASPVAAQSRAAGQLFVDVTAFAAGQLRSSTDQTAPVVTRGDLSAVVPGAAVAIGTFLTPRVSLRAEAAFPWDVNTDYSESYDEAILLGATSLLTTTTDYENEYGNRNLSVLLGYHSAPHRRFAVSYMGGVAFVRERQSLSIVISTPGIPPFIPARTNRQEISGTNYRAAAALGMDVEIPFSTHLSLVPQVRVVAFTGEISVRPGVGLRWMP